MIGMRTRLIYATLALSASAWSLDFLTTSIPQAAKAAGEIAPPEETGQIAAGDLRAVVAALKAVPRQRAPLTLVNRNLFKAPAPPPTLVEPATPTRDAESDEMADVSIANAPPALPDLVLDGIMAGRQRLALINGQVMARGQELEGYRVRFIGTDHVLLDGLLGRIRLDLAKPELMRQNN